MPTADHRSRDLRAAPCAPGAPLRSARGCGSCVAATRRGLTDPEPVRTDPAPDRFLRCGRIVHRTIRHPQRKSMWDSRGPAITPHAGLLTLPLDQVTVLVTPVRRGDFRRITRRGDAPRVRRQPMLSSLSWMTDRKV